MNIKPAVCIAFLSMYTPLVADTGARVFCWAPHLSAPILLNSHGQGIGSYAGRPFSYKIFGVAGILTLGDRCDGAFPDPNDSQKRFRRGWWIGGLTGRTNIYSSVKLQVNWQQFYPKRLEVTGDRPGSTSGPVRIYGDTWNTTQMFGHPEVTLVFHLAGNQDSAIPNRNPSGFFYVVGEYLTGPPTVTGTLNVTAQSIMRGGVTPVGYTINRTGGVAQSPPFTGYNQAGEVVFPSSN